MTGVATCLLSYVPMDGHMPHLNHRVSSLALLRPPLLSKIPEDSGGIKEPYPKPKGKRQKSGSGTFALCLLVFALCLDSSSTLVCAGSPPPMVPAPPG